MRFKSDSRFADVIAITADVVIVGAEAYALRGKLAYPEGLHTVLIKFKSCSVTLVVPISFVKCDVFSHPKVHFTSFRIIPRSILQALGLDLAQVPVLGWL